MDTRPRSVARRTIPSSSGATTIRGKMVTISTLSIDQLRFDRHYPPALEVHFPHELLGQWDESLAGLPPHDENGHAGAGLQDLLGATQDALRRALDPQAQDLVMVVRPLGQGFQVFVRDADVEAAERFRLVDGVD